jgi:hypothetical protein
VVLSTTISDALAGTETVDTIGKSVPAPAAALSIDTVVLTAFVPSTLDATMLLILKTRPEDAALDNKTFAVVLAGVKKVVMPLMTVTFTIFGFAMMVPYRPKIIEKAMA